MLIFTLRAPEIVRICIGLPKNENSNPKDMRYSEKLNLHCNSIWPREAKVYLWDPSEINTNRIQSTEHEGLKLRHIPGLTCTNMPGNGTLSAVTHSKSQKKVSKISSQGRITKLYFKTVSFLPSKIIPSVNQAFKSILCEQNRLK